MFFPMTVSKSGQRNEFVELDSFIISATPYNELRQIYGEGDWDEARFAAAHILFAEDDYVPAVFSQEAPRTLAG